MGDPRAAFGSAPGALAGIGGEGPGGQDAFRDGLGLVDDGVELAPQGGYQSVLGRVGGGLPRQPGPGATAAASASDTSPVRLAAAPSARAASTSSRAAAATPCS